MAAKRKRNRCRPSVEDRPGKRIKKDDGKATDSACPTVSPVVQHPVLSLYYPYVLSLRQFLLSGLPASSKVRRRRLVAIGGRAEKETPGCRNTEGREDAWDGHVSCADQVLSCSEDHDKALTSLLDTTLVCCSKPYVPTDNHARTNDLVSFSQQNSTMGSSLDGGACSQSEVCGCFLACVDVSLLLCPQSHVRRRLRKAW